MTKKLKTSAEGRKCLEPDCDKILSIYNHSKYCRVHLEKIQAKEETKPYRHVMK